jgi:transcriptional regulator with XRE-family HTH domain
MPSTTDVEQVGRIVRERREQRAWRQSDLGERAGVNQQQISRIENGVLANPDLGELIRICDVLEIDLDVIADVYRRRRPSGRRRPQLQAAS